MFLWLLKAAKKELTLPPSLSAEQLRAYTGYAQPAAPSPFRCAGLLRKLQHLLLPRP